MAKREELNFNLPSVDELFEPAQGKDILNLKKVIPISIKDISDFPGHPFKVKDDDKEMLRLIESVNEIGVAFPALVRPKKDGGYEMISGHRRKRAAELANLTEIPCIIRNLTDEEATILMVDSNMQREEILPSEKAFAYKMKFEAQKQQGKRTDLTSCQLGEKLRTDKKLAETAEDSARQIQRYIRLTELISPLLDMVDEKKIAFNPAVEISYLTHDEQYVLLDCIQCSLATPSQAQAIHMKKLSQEGKLTTEKIENIMAQQKPNQKPNYKINYERFEKVLPRNLVTEKEVEDFLFACVEEHNKRQKMRAMSR